MKRTNERKKQQQISEYLSAGSNCCFLSFKLLWLLISLSPTYRKFHYYLSLVSHPSLLDFPINREAVLFPFVALVSLVPPISQRWDSARFQSQCTVQGQALYTLINMKTWLKYVSGEARICMFALSADSWNWLSPLFNWSCGHSGSSQGVLHICKSFITC